MYKKYLIYSKPIKIGVSILLVAILLSVLSRSYYLEKGAIKELCYLFIATLSYYFPYEVSSFTGFQRFYNSDVTIQPHWWVEITGLIGVLFSSYIILF